jgi:hypothetical protein
LKKKNTKKRPQYTKGPPKTGATTKSEVAGSAALHNLTLLIFFKLTQQTAVDIKCTHMY